MLKPRFLLTKTVPVPFYRTTQGSYVNGKWVEGVETTFTLDVNIQPLKDSEILILPEAERTREWYKGYCAEEVRSAKEGTGGYAADEFTWQGERYRVMKVRNYAMGTLDHFRFSAARVELTQ